MKYLEDVEKFCCIEIREGTDIFSDLDQLYPFEFSFLVESQGNDCSSNI